MYNTAKILQDDYMEIAKEDSNVIDIENELFTKVATVLRDKYTPIFVTGEYVKAPLNFLVYRL